MKNFKGNFVSLFFLATTGVSLLANALSFSIRFTQPKANDQYALDAWLGVKWEGRDKTVPTTERKLCLREVVNRVGGVAGDVDAPIEICKALSGMAHQPRGMVEYYLGSILILPTSTVDEYQKDSTYIFYFHEATRETVFEGTEVPIFPPEQYWKVFYEFRLALTLDPEVPSPVANESRVYIYSPPFALVGPNGEIPNPSLFPTTTRTELEEGDLRETQTSSALPIPTSKVVSESATVSSLPSVAKFGIAMGASGASVIILLLGLLFIRERKRRRRQIDILSGIDRLDRPKYNFRQRRSSTRSFFALFKPEMEDTSRPYTEKMDDLRERSRAELVAESLEYVRHELEGDGGHLHAGSQAEAASRSLRNVDLYIREDSSGRKAT